MNSLVAYERPVTIVLDDLHTVRSETSLRSIEHAIERLPPTARLLAATRSEPAISLAPLRASRALIEIRARELAFTVDEARELIAREGIKLSGESLELLVERTEGWPAGLYLAALWLRDFAKPDEGVQAFAGNARQIADYLTAEVLTVLDAQTRDFLVRTSVLDRFTPELCDAVIGREDSAAVLAKLARSNMFLVAAGTPEGSGIATTICSASFCGWSWAPRKLTPFDAARWLGAVPKGTSRTRSSTPPLEGKPNWWPSCSSSTTASSSGAGEPRSSFGGYDGFHLNC